MVLKETKINGSPRGFTFCTAKVQPSHVLARDQELRVKSLGEKTQHINEGLLYRILMLCCLERHRLITLIMYQSPGNFQIITLRSTAFVSCVLV
jgi:hypothetical protein